jgi:cell division protein FtsI/penicillin-binding protein 2
MKISEFVTEEELQDLDEKASRALCLSTKPNSKLGKSNLDSCKAQGLRARTGKRKYWIDGKRRNVAGKKVKSSEYGGSLKRKSH